MNKLSIKNWSIDDRPREKLISNGKKSLSDAELLAIIIGSGSRTASAVELSQRILHQYNNDLNQLSKCTIKDLMGVKGIGEAKAVSIMAAIELGLRRKNTHKKERQSITSSQDVFDIMQSKLADLPYEEFWAVFLNRSNKIIDKVKFSQGGVSGTVVDVRMILKSAIQHLASSIILVHNHPSGNINPSTEDIHLTTKLKEGAKLIDIQVLDHLIVCDNLFYSFADEGVF